MNEYTPEAEAARWAQLCRQFRLPREPTRALLLAIRNGAEADAFTADGATHVFLHLPDATLASALCADALFRAGFVHDGETGAWTLAHAGIATRRAR